MLIDLLTGRRLFTADGGAPGGGTPAPQGQPQNGGTTEKTFTQAELEAILADRLAREQRKAHDTAEKARKDAEARALAEQGQFKTLAEQHAAKVAELEPKAGQVERFEKALRAQVEQLRQGLPDYIAPLLDRMDVAEQLEYLAANRAKLVATPPPVAPNINGGGGGAAPAPDQKQREAELRQRFRLGGR